MFFEQHDVYYDNWHERPEPYEKWDASLIHASRVAREACVSMSVDLIQDRLFTSKQVDGPTSNEIIESMKHHGFNNWYGHGSPYGVKTACYAHILATTKQTLLSHPPFLSHDKSSNLTLEDLKNKDYPSVIYSISCTNMPFDNPIIDSIQFVNNNLAEIFTVNSRNGGPAFLGNTREGWFNVNKLNSLESGASPSLHAAFIRAIEKYNNIGIAEAMSKENCSDNRVKHGHNLIGDPEFKIWLTEPHSHSFIETIGDNTLSFNGSSLRSSSIHIYGGKPGKSRSYKINNISPIIQLDNIFHNSIYSYSIWRNGYLPIIKLEAQNLNIKGETLSFVVRTAKLGSTVNRNKTCGDVIVNNNTDLSIRAVDSIDVIDSIIIKQSGKLSLQCDKNISVSGVAVESGGNLDIKGEAVSLGQGFCIKKGASCCIKPN